MSLLSAKELSKRYHGTVALNNLNLSVDKGEIFCLLGQNGAGKTTTINIFLGVTHTTSSKAAVNGFDIKPNNPATRKFIAYIPEVVQLYGNLNGLENLHFFSRLAGFKYTNSLLSNFLNRAVNVGTRIGIMKQGTLVHVVDPHGITANELQQLYLETI